MYNCIYICIYIYIYTNICVCVHVYIYYTFIHEERKRERGSQFNTLMPNPHTFPSDVRFATSPEPGSPLPSPRPPPGRGHRGRRPARDRGTGRWLAIPSAHRSPRSLRDLQLGTHPLENRRITVENHRKMMVF